MNSDGTQGETAASQGLPGSPISDRSRISRRQALGRISAVAGAGAAAWVVPEIFLAKPAAGAALSGPAISPGSPPGASPGSPPGASPGSPPGASPGSPPGASSGSPPITNGATTNGTGGSATPPKAVTTGATTTSPVESLAFTGLNLQRDAEIGAALVAGGWAMKYWASRTQKERPTS
jgi:hypothetical protein